MYVFLALKITMTVIFHRSFFLFLNFNLSNRRTTVIIKLLFKVIYFFIGLSKFVEQSEMNEKKNKQIFKAIRALENGMSQIIAKYVYQKKDN